MRLGLQAEQRARPHKSAADLGVLHVLVVDDNASAREILCSMLSEFGFRVDDVASGEEALAAVAASDRDDPYQLVLMDWRMPGKDGVETTRALHARDDLHFAPTVIMVTAYGRDEAGRAAEGAGVGAFLTKPVTSSSLLDAVMAAMGREVSPAAHGAARHDEMAQALAQLRGARVLLVEDNDINQELALHLLVSNGISAAAASDGREALKVLALEHFDGVLMDCQMPVMDGYAATREIRRRARLKELPVIAMTANVMAGDREKALAAGMNDHIGKPIDVLEMFTTMARWIHPRAPSTKAPPKITEPRSAAPLPPLPGIDANAGLARIRGNRGLYRRLLQRFRDTHRGFAEEFRQARAGGDPDAPMRVAHTLKGVAGNIGAEGVRAAAQALETACREQAPAETVERLADAVAAALAPALAGLASLDHAGSVATAADPVAVRGLLASLRELLERDDTDAVEVIDALEPMLRKTAQAYEVTRLARAVAEYDFDSALRALDTLEAALAPPNVDDVP